jgi:hypothetical protein
MPGLYQTRSEVAKAARDERMREWFGTRKWRVKTEVTRTMLGIMYDHGEFWVKPPNVFQTPFGHKGRHGLIITEIDPDTGKDLVPAVLAAFGHTALVKAQDLYKCFPAGLPAERSRPPR